MTDKERRNRFFAIAIALQQLGAQEEASQCARICLELCKPYNTLEDVAAGQVIEIAGITVCLPDYLHEGTALKRFRAVGINV